ncbi:bifunctional diguanylate cyclase/phosphodiesterase [Ideonella margarita]|uniref:EAL domain-containing protein n=1 Tax=Ideonella margarita TaxID=2984191 RepID=A0ABU9C7H6_9BURK
MNAASWMRPFTRSLGRRIVGLFLVLLLVVQAIGFMAIGRSIDANARSQLDEQMVLGERILRRLLLQNTKVLSDGLMLLSRDFGFLDAVKGGDAATVGDALDNQARRIGANFAALLDPALNVVASGHSSQQAVLALKDTLRRGADGQLPTAVLTLVEGRPFQFVVSPLKPPQFNDVVVMGFPLDQELVDGVEALSGAQLALVTSRPNAGPTMVLTSMSAANAPVLMTLPPGRAEAVLDAEGRVGEPVLARTVVLASEANGELRAVLYRSIDQAVAPYRRLQAFLGLITLIGVVVFTLGSLFMARHLTRPVQVLVAASRRLGDGDFDTPVSPDALRRSDELGELAVAFDGARGNLADATAQIRQLAFWDKLTGLPNRVRFEALLRDAMAQHAQVAVLVLNLDRLEKVNQLLGRQQGDRVLRCAAERLQALARRLPELPLGGDECVARLGGDEFALLLPGAGEDRACEVATQLQQVFEHPVALEDSVVDLSAGIGLAVGPAHGDSAEALLAHALLAMSEAKRRMAGMLVYQPSIDAGSAQTLSLLGELRQALRLQELRLYLQPKLGLVDANLVGAEALVRWQHPVRGLVPPVQFIPFAEETGFIHELTLWVVDEAARLWSVHAANGFELRLSVNLSAHDLMKADLLARLVARLDHHGAPPRALCLEITESAIALDPVRALQTLHALKAHGFKLSIDDFGAGYTSLAQLIDLPVDELKIDMLFVRTMDKDADKASMVGSLIRMAHDRHLSVVAEGVENAVILEQLRELGCDEGQGWHIGKPMPGSELQAWAASRWPERVPAVVSNRHVA